MQTDLITDADRLDPDVLSAWDELAVESALPYASPAWMLAFWREMHEPSGAAELRVVVVREGARIVGIGPFYAGAPRAWGMREWWPLGAGYGQRVAPLARDGRESDVAAELARVLAAQDVTVVRLPASDAAVPWSRWLTMSWPSLVRPRDIVHMVEPAPSVTLRDDGDHGAWLAARSRNFRAEVNRRTRMAGKRGGVVRRIDDADEVPAAVSTLFGLQRERLAAHGRTSLIWSHVERAVAAGATALMRSGDRTRLWVVQAPEGIVGGDIHLVAGARMCCYNGGISPDWARESLGTLLLEAAVRDAHGLGMHSLDLGGGDHPYKWRFADRNAPLAWCSVVPRGVRYPLERGRLLPGDARHLAKRMVARLPEHHRELLLALRRPR